jgi:hypothetical protein
MLMNRDFYTLTFCIGLQHDLPAYLRRIAILCFQAIVIIILVFPFYIAYIYFLSCVRDALILGTKSP